MAIIIKWNKKAIKQFEEAIEYIELGSPVNASQIKKEILFKIYGLLQHPEKYNPDKYKTKNDGSFRAFEIHHYRLSYRYKKGEIHILRIRHTKMNPLEY